MSSVCSSDSMKANTESLLERVKAYYFPGGENAARTIRKIKTTQRGEIRSGPEARWVVFRANEYVDAVKSSFCWNARMGSGLRAVDVTDAYENGHGRLVVRKGPIRLKEFVGVDVDKGELQRYLAYVSYCPPMLVNNPSLEFITLRPGLLRLRNRTDPAQVSVDLEIEHDGFIRVAHALRPMMVGKSIEWTRWSATASDMEEREGLRVPRILEASWHPPQGSFTYIRIEVLDFEFVRQSRRI